MIRIRQRLARILTGRFQPGPHHPRWRSDEELIGKLRTKRLGTLTLTGRLEKRSGSRRYVEVRCSVCRTTKWVLADNLLAGTTRNCVCQRNQKYYDSRARTLGTRYDSMIQRCERDTHVSSHNYKGRGIRVKFRNREHFVRWALTKFPDSDFKGLDFDRIDNNGHYTPNNLRLVPRSKNLLNRRR